MKMCTTKKAHLVVFLLLLFSGSAFAQKQIIELKFNQPADTGSSASRSLETLVKVRSVGEQYSTGGLYLMTHSGDFDDLFQKENQREMNNPMVYDSWRWCSIFSTKVENSVIMGRNWDNQNVGSVIVSLCKPLKGYSSISFTRAIDLGFPLNVDLVEVKSTPFASKLLLAPFYAYDGLNDQGVCAAVTGIEQVKITPTAGKEAVFISYLVRKILDQAKSTDEAVRLVEQYIPFDLDRSSLDCHFYVVDASGRSVVLEYAQNGWRKTYSDRSWQVMTNRVVYEVPDTTLRGKCWRYKRISETLEKVHGRVDWHAGMQLLKDVSQGGTTWSVIYSPTSKDVFFSVYQSWDKIYHLRGF
jgi:hypothetical protein